MAETDQADQVHASGAGPVSADAPAVGTAAEVTASGDAVIVNPAAAPVRMKPAHGHGTLTPFNSHTGYLAAHKAAEAKRRRRARLEAAKRLGVRVNARDLKPEELAVFDGLIPAEWPDEYRVVAVLARQHAQNAYDPSAPGSAQSARWLESGWPEPRRGVASELPDGGVRLELTAEAAAAVVGALARALGRDSGDGGE